MEKITIAEVGAALEAGGHVPWKAFGGHESGRGFVVASGRDDEVLVYHITPSLDTSVPGLDNDLAITAYARALTRSYSVNPVTYPATRNYLSHYLEVRRHES